MSQPFRYPDQPAEEDGKNHDVTTRRREHVFAINVLGGPTDDKPGVTLITPPDPGRTSAFLNVRVADIAKVYQEWSAKGAEFLTPPKDHGREIRAYVRDPDGHLIEVGQATGLLN
ncbi:MAG TPA: VOC family protein [Streptosporangiaceae bacterium]|nr:VOC family protein [Streptosporangiaceae bacterium]